MYRDETCIKSDVCDMAVCDGAECNHRASTVGSANTSTNSARDAIAAWENHCKWHLKMNGPGCGIENDGKCKHWFIMGYNAATAPVA